MKVKILDIDRTSTTGYLKQGSLNVTRQSEHRRSCELTLNVTANTYYPTVGQDLKVYDNSDALIFGGVIKRTVMRQDGGGNSADSPLAVTVTSDGYNSIAKRRTIYTFQEYKYAGEIAERLRHYVLNDPAYNEGVAAASTVVEVGAWYDEYEIVTKNLAEVFDGLAKDSGFQWYIDNDKVFHFEQDSSTIGDAAHSLLSTGTFKDFFDVEVENSLDEYRNKQIVVGGLDEYGITIQAAVYSTGQIAERLSVEGGSCYTSGIYGNVITDPNIQSLEDAEDVANNALKQFGRTGRITFKSYQTDWEPITKLRVKLPKYGIATDKYYLIESVTLEKTYADDIVATVFGTERNEDDFSSQKTYDDIAFMAELVAVAKENGLSGGAGSMSESVLATDYSATSTAQLTVSSSESTLLTKTIELASVSDIKVFFTCAGASTGALDVTFKTYKGGVARTYQPVQSITGANNETITYLDTISAEPASTGLTIAIKGLTSATDFLIPSGFAHMNLLVLPYISSLIMEDVSGFVATVISYSEIDLTWVNPTSAGFTGVEVYKHSASLTSYDRAWCDANADLIYSGTNQAYNNTGLDAETTYFYKVFAVYADDTGTHYSLGVVTNATTSSGYQSWEGYADSPDLLGDYPYEFIIEGTYPALYCSDTRPYYNGTSIQKAAGNSKYYYSFDSGATWTYVSTWGSVTILVERFDGGQANFNLTANSDGTGTVYLAKTTP
jgi:hypothetical protein